jgi:lysophospholipase L1-like esterase
MEKSSSHPCLRQYPSRIRLFRFLLAILLLLVTLGGGELLVRLVAPQPLNGRWTEAADSGLLINRASWGAHHQLDDVSVEYRFNQHHLRGGPIGPGKRVLMLGDSFTFGWLLPEEDTYVCRLGAEADRCFGPDRVQLLNGGKGGWGTADYLAFLEEFGDTIAPDAVVVFLNFADIHRSLSGGLYRFRAGDQNLLDRRSKRPSALRRFKDHLAAYDWLLAHSHLTHVIRHAFGGCKHKGPPLLLDEPGQAAGRGRPKVCTVPRPAGTEPAPGDPNSNLGRIAGQSLFRRLHSWCTQRGVPLLVVTTGFQTRFLQPPVSGSYYDVDFLRCAPDFFTALDVPFHDLTPQLKRAVGKNWEDYLIPGDGHPNARGAQLVAGAVWPWLRPHLETMMVSGGALAPDDLARTISATSSGADAPRSLLQRITAGRERTTSTRAGTPCTSTPHRRCNSSCSPCWCPTWPASSHHGCARAAGTAPARTRHRFLAHPAHRTSISQPLPSRRGPAMQPG